MTLSDERFSPVRCNTLGWLPRGLEHSSCALLDILFINQSHISRHVEEADNLHRKIDPWLFYAASPQTA